MMKRRYILMVGLALYLALAMLAFAQGKGNKKGKKGGEAYISVKVTFDDADGYRIKSDGSGPYYDNQEGVKAIVGVDGGKFRIDTNGKGRTVFLDFSNSNCADLEPEGCDPFPHSPFQDIDLRIGLEYDENGPTENQLDIVEMAGGDTKYGALSIDFAPTGQWSKLYYRIVFGKFPPMGLCEADPVTVVRGVDTAGEPENSWTFSAGADDVGWLYKIEKNFKIVTLVGKFYLPFSIDVVEQ